MSKLRGSTSTRVATFQNYEEALLVMKEYGEQFSTEKNQVECRVWSDINGIEGDNGIGYLVDGEWDKDLKQIHWQIKYYTFGLRFLEVKGTGYDPKAKMWWVLFKIRS